MKKIEIIAICCCLCAVGNGITGCHQSKKQSKPSFKEVQDRRITVSLSRVGATNEFLLSAQYAGKIDMIWWIAADADLFDAKGKFVPARKAGTSRFHWKEDDESTTSHWGDYRRDNPLKETLVLDKEGLAPGKYRAVPSVNIFERGKDAHPKMKDPFYRDEHGIRPGKVQDIVFTVNRDK